MSEKLEDRVVLITGSAKGIGLACSVAFLEAGHKVALHYRSENPQIAELCSKYPKAQAFQADLAEKGAVDTVTKAVKEAMGPIQVLVNNAGMTMDKLLMFSKEDDFDTMMATNLKSPITLSKLAAKQMLKGRWGRIINISSVVGHTGNPGQSLYTASKGALTSFTKSVAIELAGAGITVNCVAPGFIETAMTDKLDDKQKLAIKDKIPMARVGTPKEVAAAVFFLASEEASYITGTTLHVNGGMY